MTNTLKCDKGHVFLTPAKKIVMKHIPLLFPTNNTTSAETTVTFQQTTESIETPVCPHCNSPSFTVQEEPVAVKGEITALLSVPNNEVNVKLAEGYKILEDKIYAKETVMVKRAVPEQKTETPEHKSELKCFGTATTQDTCLLCAENKQCVKKTMAQLHTPEHKQAECAYKKLENTEAEKP
jgi:hypothetical protein